MIGQLQRMFLALGRLNSRLITEIQSWRALFSPSLPTWDSLYLLLHAALLINPLLINHSVHLSLLNIHLWGLYTILISRLHYNVDKVIYAKVNKWISTLYNAKYYQWKCLPTCNLFCLSYHPLINPCIIHQLVLTAAAIIRRWVAPW